MLTRCAMVMTVQSLNSFRMVFWMSASVSISTAAVASSRTRIFDRRSRALARQTNCRCPTLAMHREQQTYIKRMVKTHIIFSSFCIPNINDLTQNISYLSRGTLELQCLTCKCHHFSDFVGPAMFYLTNQNNRFPSQQ